MVRAHEGKWQWRLARAREPLARLKVSDEGESVEDEHMPSWKRFSNHHGFLKKCCWSCNINIFWMRNEALVIWTKFPYSLRLINIDAYMRIVKLSCHYWKKSIWLFIWNIWEEVRNKDWLKNKSETTWKCFFFHFFTF